MKLLILFFFSFSALSFDTLNAPDSCSSCADKNDSFINNLEAIQQKVSPYKTEWELELYRRKYGHCLSSYDKTRDCGESVKKIARRCFTKDHVKHSMTRNEKIALKKMAEIFDIPYSLLYCTFFIESRFKPFAKSQGVGAQGMAQVMPGTQNTLKSYFTMPGGSQYTNCLNEKNLKYYQANNMYSSLRLCNVLKQRAKDYKERWRKVEEYYISLGIINNSLTPKCNAYKPFCAIAIGAANYFYNIREIQKAFPKLKLDTNDFTTVQMLMPTYNAGPGVVFSANRVKAIQACQKNNKLISNCVIEKLKAAYKNNPKKYHYLPEPLGYTPGISNCMLKDNYDPPTKGEVSLSCK